MSIRRRKGMEQLKKIHTSCEWKQIFESEEFKEDYLYQGLDLGSTYSKEKTIFKVWAPSATEVVLNLYQTGSDEEENAKLIDKLPMKEESRGIWEKTVNGDWNGIYYTYTITANGKKNETADIYAKACGINGQRSMVINLESTNPEGWEQDKFFTPNTKTPVIYELHIKDFSSDDNSGISEKHRGKYLAFTEKNTKSTGLSYLQSLGITHVHLLPFYDFASVDESRQDNEQFNWGYDPLNYNVPEGSYSTNPYQGEVRIKEVKQMIQALHEAGIAVVMDVVYNHTYSTNSWFQYTVPYYYYRTNEQGEFSAGSMCGNDTASEHEMFRKFMIDSVCYWTKEYHIDGFRFDLMGLHDTDTMNEIRDALNRISGEKNILMYGEPWSGDYTSIQEGYQLANKENIRLLKEGIAVFCDNIRDSIKGSVFEADEPGFVNGNLSLINDIKSSVCGWLDGADKKFMPYNPRQIVSYVSSHDNYTLWDKLQYTLKAKPDFKGTDKELIQINKMAAGIYFTCLGIPFFQAGEEGARTKQGIENSYKTSSSINQIDWKRIHQNEDLVNYYRGLIDIRKHFTALSSESDEILKQIKFLEIEEEAVVGYVINGNRDLEDKWNELCIFYNGNDKKVVVDLPAGEWKLLSDGKQMGLSELISERIILNQHSVTILGK
ncbi:type I pullulanase [Lachnospiraceae bacterium WCA-693-APC-MOT-I]|uniref:Type I pullulanase n=2 Tax=Velocimicrobium porci TaxID=2606634 RepID=A0A6L5XX39_9FIRM|nr:type I pullulanase [Velocimicrobium porci]